MAPLVERLDMGAWVKAQGQPPLQVLCITDGFDNCSIESVRSLSGLVRELKQITGPATGHKLYLPTAGPVPKHTTLMEGESPKVPVWLAWIACGLGGQMMLNKN